MLYNCSGYLGSWLYFRFFIVASSSFPGNGSSLYTCNYDIDEYWSLTCNLLLLGNTYRRELAGSDVNDLNVMNRKSIHFTKPSPFQVCIKNKIQRKYFLISKKMLWICYIECWIIIQIPVLLLKKYNLYAVLICRLCNIRFSLLDLQWRLLKICLTGNNVQWIYYLFVKNTTILNTTIIQPFSSWSCFLICNSPMH